MRTPHLLSRMAGAAALAFIAVASSATAATWNVGPTGDFSTIAAAIASASVTNGDTLNVAAGTYQHASTTLTINKSLTIVGAGMGQTIITHTTALNTDTTTVNITAANVTLRNLTIQYGNGEGATMLRGVGATTSAANTTFENVDFSIRYARRGVFVNNNSTNTIFRGCRFRGSMNREVIDINNNSNPAAGTMIIEDCVFEQSHYQQGSIFFDGTEGQNAIIRRNFFVSRIGVFDANGDYVDGNSNYGFQSDGTLLYGIFVGTLAAGRSVEVSHNTFVFQDGSLTNPQGRVPLMKAIETSGTANYATSPLVIRDNIFTGFATELDTTSPAHIWQTAGGVFGGAIELDGINSFGEMAANAALNVGAKGTLSVWVKLDNTGKRHQILEGPGDGGLEFQYRSNTSGQFYMRPYNGSEFVIQSGNQGTTNWYLVQYTWDQASAIARVYSGNQATPVAESAYLAANDQNISGWTAPVDTTTGTFNFGTDPGDLGRLFDGRIDDLVLFNDVLTPAELESLRTAGGASFTADSRLVAHFPFDETSGSTAASTVNGLSIAMQDLRVSLNTGAAAIQGNSTVTVANNLYFNNDNPELIGVTDTAPVLGDPQFAGTGATTRDVYTPLLTSPAVGAASDGHTIGAVSFQPTITANSALLVVSGQSAALTAARLNASDPEQGPAGLTYTVTAAPTHGSLLLATFTQQQLNDGAVVYTNAGTGATDSFAFSLSDGYTDPVTGTFNISIISSAVDTDRDGLPDALEVILGTNPNNRDSDGDGVEDGVEVAIGSNPLSAIDPVSTVDSDRDLIPDAYELANGFTVGSADEDGDGVLDGYEFAVNQAPSLAGTPLIGESDNNPPVNILDASRILENFLGITPVVAPDENRDIDRDGIVNNVDAVLLYQFTLMPKRIPVLPLQP